ncbi:MAG: major outer membrane protein [Campylobacteraceae bacterium]|nr:major outer membrane protein [Campylobacteraceae bacterium]
MKITKLSLAALVAVGAMTTFANAGSLEQAIKGVDVSGYTRYRSDKVTDQDSDHKFTGEVNVVSPVAENLKAGVTVEGDVTNTDSVTTADVRMTKLWFEYATKRFSVKAGQFSITSPWTDNKGNGIQALYSAVPNWTFAAAGYLNTDIALGGENNLYAMGAMGKTGPVDLQVWAAHLNDAVDYTFFGDAKFVMAGLSVELQANYLKLAEEAYGLAGVKHDAGVFYGAKLGYARNGFSGSAGYTQNDKDQPIYSLAGSDAAGFIFSGGKQINGNVANRADAKLMFLDLGYALNKFDVGAGYAYAKASEDIGSEWYVQAGYNYSKNFRLSGYYSSLDLDKADDTQKVRFEAKYSF